MKTIVETTDTSLYILQASGPKCDCDLHGHALLYTPHLGIWTVSAVRHRQINPEREIFVSALGVLQNTAPEHQIPHTHRSRKEVFLVPGRGHIHRGDEAPN